MQSSGLPEIQRAAHEAGNKRAPWFPPPSFRSQHLSLVPSFHKTFQWQNYHNLGSAMYFISSASRAVGHSFRGKLSPGGGKVGAAWWASRPCFPGEAKPAAAESVECPWLMIGFLGRCFLNVQADSGLDLTGARLHFVVPSLLINFIRSLDVKSQDRLKDAEWG